MYGCNVFDKVNCENIDLAEQKLQELGEIYVKDESLGIFLENDGVLFVKLDNAMTKDKVKHIYFKIDTDENVLNRIYKYMDKLSLDVDSFFELKNLMKVSEDLHLKERLYLEEYSGIYQWTPFPKWTPLKETPYYPSQISIQLIAKMVLNKKAKLFQYSGLKSKLKELGPRSSDLCKKLFTSNEIEIDTETFKSNIFMCEFDFKTSARDSKRYKLKYYHCSVEESISLVCNSRMNIVELIPEESRTADFWTGLVKKNPYKVEYMPVKYITTRLCKQLLHSDGCYLALFPEKFKTKELCDVAVFLEPLAIQFVPSKFKNSAS